MPMLNQVKNLYVRSNHSFEDTSYLNSYCRCLADWAHYQGQQDGTGRAAGSRNSNSASKSQSVFQKGKSQVAGIGKFFVRSRDFGGRKVWNRCVSAVEGLFSRPADYSQLAEESAQSCLEGLSRFAVSGESGLKLKPHSDRAMVRLLDLNRPLLLSAGRAA